MDERVRVVRPEEEMVTVVAGSLDNGTGSIRESSACPAPRNGGASRLSRFLPSAMVGRGRQVTGTAAVNSGETALPAGVCSSGGTLPGAARPPRLHKSTAAKLVAACAPTGKRGRAKASGELDAQRKKIRTLEEETAAIQQQYETAKARGEREMQTLFSQVDLLQRELLQQREELEATRASGERPCQCVVCLEDGANHMVVPCGHLAFCHQCSSVALTHCPVCRQGAECIVRVFRL